MNSMGMKEEDGDCGSLGRERMCSYLEIGGI